MAIQLTAGTTLQCSFGAAPGVLSVLPVNRVLAGAPAGNIMDNKPIVNVAPFGACSSASNPVVAAATAAALGALTPMPCVPLLVAPWIPVTPTKLIANMPEITNACKLMCMWGGVIQPVAPAQFTVMPA